MATSYERLIRPGGDQLIRGLFGYGGDMQDIGNLDFMSGAMPNGFMGTVGPTFQNAAQGNYYVQNPYLGFATNDAGQRFGDWQPSWNRRFATDAVGPDGQTQKSAVTGTGSRMNREFGGFFPGGDPRSVGSTDLWGTLFGQGGQASQYTSGQGLQGQFYDPSAWGGAVRGDTGAYRGAVAGNPYSDPNKWVADASPLAEQYRNFIQSNPYSDPTQWSADLDPMNQTRMGQLGQYSPEAAAKGAFDLAQARTMAGYDPLAIAREGIGMGSGYDKKAMADLSASIDSEAQRSLALQLPEVQAQAQMLGLTDGAASQRLGGDVARDVTGQAAREKARLMAQYSNDASNRQNSLISNFQQLGAQAGNQLFGEAAGLFGQQYGARENALNSMYSTGAGMLGQGQQAAYDAANRMGNSIYAGEMGLLGQGQQSAYNAMTGMERDIMNAQTGATMAGMGANMDRGNLMAQLGANTGLGIMGQLTNRMGMEDNAQNNATQMWMNLMNSQDTMHDSRMNALLAMSGMQQNDEQQRQNMMLNYGMMPMNWLMNMVTGTPQGSTYTPGANNWMSLIGGAVGPAANYGFNMLDTGSRAPNPGDNRYSGMGGG